jgi:hypothetical protein
MNDWTTWNYTPMMGETGEVPLQMDSSLTQALDDIQRNLERATVFFECIRTLVRKRTLTLAACRRERSFGHVSRSDYAQALHDMQERLNGASSQAENGRSCGTVRAGRMPLPLCYAQDKVWKRLRLKAKQTRHHSPAAAVVPRNENWRKPSTSLMIPITGSTAYLRAL